MVKEYSLHEVLDTEGIEFKTESGIVVYAEKGQLYIKLKVIMEIVKWACPLNKEWINTKFIKVQKPVSFMDVVKTNEKCRVEHEFVANGSVRGSLEFIIYYLGQTQTSEKIKKIILEGKWYIEI